MRVRVRSVRCVLKVCSLIAVASAAYGKSEREIQIDRSDLAVIDSRVHENIEVAGVLLNDRNLSEYLAGMVARLVGVPEGTVAPYRALLINGSEINAFSLSDGTIYISLGIFSLIDNDAQLALLLAHEIAHVRLDHHRLFRYELHEKTAGTPLFGGIDTPYNLRVALSGFSKSLERQADSCALRTVIDCGYNAWEAKNLISTMYFWLKYKEMSYDSTGATHPTFAERYRTSKKILQSLGVDTSAGVVGLTSYQEMIRPHLQRIVALLKESNYVNELYKMALHKLDGGAPLPQWYYLRGSLLERYEAADSFEVGVASLTSAFSKDPSNTRSIRDLGWLYLKNGKRDSARVCLRRYLAVTPEAEDNGIVRFYLERLHE